MEGQVIGYLLSNILLAAGGVLVTHLFRGFILTRGWLGLAPGSLVTRIVGAIPVLSLLYVGLTYLESPVECLPGQTQWLIRLYKPTFSLPVV